MSDDLRQPHQYDEPQQEMHSGITGGIPMTRQDEAKVLPQQFDAGESDPDISKLPAPLEGTGTEPIDETRLLRHEVEVCAASLNAPAPQPEDGAAPTSWREAKRWSDRITDRAVQVPLWGSILNRGK